MIDHRFASAWRAVARRRADASPSAPGWTAVVAVVGAVVVHAVVAWGSHAPVFALDEVVMVGNSRVIAGVEPTWNLGGAGFMPGMGVVLAPLWWVFSSAPSVYAAGVWVTALLAVLTIWPMARILQQFSVEAHLSVVVAAVIMMAPARALLSNYLLSESLLLLLLCWMLVAALRWIAHPTVKTSVLFGVVTGAVVLSHGRGVAIAVAMGLWCLTMMRRDRWWQPALAASTAVIVSVGAYVLYLWCTAALLTVDNRVQDSLSVERPDELETYFSVALGQLWYATLAWPLCVVLGAAALTRRVRRDAFSRLILAMVLVLWLLSVAQPTPGGGADRLDLWFYGRYMDPLWAVLAAVGLGYALRVRWPLATAVAVGSTAIVGAAFWWVTVPHLQVDEFWASVHVLGVEPWLSLESYADSMPQPWTWLAILPTLLAALLGVLAYVRWWLLPTVAILWAALTVTTDATDIDVLMGSRAVVDDPYAFDDLPGEARIGADPSINQAVNMLAFYSGDRRVALIAPSDINGDIDVLYTPFTATEPEEAGARMLETTAENPIVAWIYPGPLQTQLDAEGRLVER